jgi:flagellar assembly protein FliH
MPKEMQSAYQRWEMNSFGDERPSVVAKRVLEPVPPPAPVIELPTAEEVAAIYDQARREGYEEGRAQGHADGYADGMAIGRTESEAELAHIKSIAATFGQAVAQADETIASDVLDLALHLARSMLRTALDVKPELVIPVVREAIEYLPVLQQPALLALHPADAQLVRTALAEELDKGGWRVIEDAQVGRGGCKVDTASNQIDAQAAARWQRLAHALGKNVEWLGA